MLKKMKIAVLAAIVLMAISSAALARDGYGRGDYRGRGGDRYYRPVYRQCDYRPVYRPVYYGYAPCPRPVYVYPRSGIVISTGSIVIGIGF
ncbi:MAG: hypothetical protein ABSE89_03820 [Sedimentisphaerales bacterium]